MLSNGSCQNQDDDEWTNLSDTRPDVEHIDEAVIVIKQVLNILRVLRVMKKVIIYFFPGEPESTPTVQSPTSYNLRSSSWLNKLQVQGELNPEERVM